MGSFSLGNPVYFFEHLIIEYAAMGIELLTVAVVGPLGGAMRHRELLA
jgi:hypothetical protein